MIALDIERELAAAGCESIRTVKMPDGRFRIFTPFAFTDGDYLSLVAAPQSDGGWALSDGGQTFLRLSYSLDEKAMQAGSRQRMMEETAAFLDVTLRDGEIVRPIRAGESVSDVLFAVIQAALRLADLEKFGREPGNADFMGVLGALIHEAVPQRPVIERWTDRQRDPQGLYPADYRIEGVVRPLFVFGLQTHSRAQEAVISLQQYRAWELDFSSVAVAPDKAAIGKRNSLRLHDMADRLIYAHSPDSEQRVRGHIQRLVNGE